MAVIEVLKSDEITVLYHQEEKIIQHIMHAHVRGEVFQNAMLMATEVLIENKAVKWLSDDRLNPMLQPSDQKWSIEVWQPKIMEAGWKYWALVLPVETAGKMRMSLIADQYLKQGVTVKIFSDPDEGMAWLKTQS